MERKKNWRKKIFNWHMWLGLALTIPILIVAITAILIAHEEGLGTKEIAIKAGWLSGYGTEKEINHYLDDVKDVVFLDDKTLYGTKLGVVEQVGNKLKLIIGTQGKETRDLELIKGDIWLASKYGVYIIKSDSAILMLEGDFHGIGYSNNNLIASEGRYGFQLSNDYGKTWQANKISASTTQEELAEFTNQVIGSDYLETLSLEKLFVDIHTGKVLFGENSMWVWIDLLALSVLSTTIFGAWMWWKRKYGKRRKVQLQ